LAYPEKEWDKVKIRMRAGKRSSQLHLIKVLREKVLSRDLEIIENYKSKLLFPLSNLPMEFDAFVPKLNLAFEYQGKQHFEDTMIFGLAEQYKGSTVFPKGLSRQLIVV
jgi:hypothetical protein